MKKISIVILNYNTYVDTIKLLINLNNQDFKYFSVVIVDNKSNNNSVNEIDKFIKKFDSNYPITFIKSEVNGGYSFGNNLGMKFSISEGYENILVLNSDIIIESSQFLSSLYDRMKKKDVAVIGPKIYQKGIPEMPLYSRRFSADREIIQNLFFVFTILINRVKRRKYKFHEQEVYSVSGCCFLIDSKILKEINFFDEKVFLYGEELILSEKLYRIQQKTLFYPVLSVIHNHSQSVGSIYNQKRIMDMQRESIMYYLEKYRKDVSKIKKRLYFISWIVKKNGTILVKKIKQFRWI